MAKILLFTFFFEFAQFFSIFFPNKNYQVKKIWKKKKKS
jgi:hypothetical protein